MIQPDTPVRVNLPGDPLDGLVGSILYHIDGAASPYEVFFFAQGLSRPLVMFADDIEPLTLTALVSTRTELDDFLTERSPDEQA